MSKHWRGGNSRREEPPVGDGEIIEPGPLVSSETSVNFTLRELFAEAGHADGKHDHAASRQSNRLRQQVDQVGSAEHDAA